MDTTPTLGRVRPRCPASATTLRALLLPAATLAALSACNHPGDPGDASDTGSVQLALTQIPANLACLRVKAVGNTRTADRDIDVTPGQSSAMLSLSGLPLGRVTVTADAFAMACSAVLPTSVATWVSDPAIVSILSGQVAMVPLKMNRNGRGSVAVDFSNEPLCSADAQACLVDAECCSNLCAAGVCGPSGWTEDFNGPTLPAPWQQFSYAFTGSRNNGQTSPAGHSNLSDAPGNLRYYNDPMITAPAAPGRYSPVYDGANYWYDPSHELARPIDGSRWLLETKISWHIVNGTNSCGFNFSVSFGTTAGIGISRYRNAPQAYTSVSTASDATWTENDANDDRTMYFRLQRADGVVSAQRSLDGTTWTPLWTKDYGSALDGLAGRLAIDGIAWFQPMGCYADYDYVRLTNQ